MKRYLAPLGWGMGMLVLILDGRTAMAGAAEGVELCIRTLIPSLFPFFVLSAMLTGALSGGGLVLAGILGGYPVGAANAAAALRSGQLTAPEAERMAVLCSCAGPSFLFGVVGNVLGSFQAALILWIIHLLSVLALWSILPKCSPCPRRSRPITLQQALSGSLRAMAAVCGWVVLFRVLLAILDRWILWILPDWGRISVYGILELSNGCLALSQADPALRLVLAAGMVSFGGLCVHLQSAGVAQGLTLRLYFPGKCFQSFFSMFLASLLTPGAAALPVIVVFLAMTVLMGWILRKSAKKMWKSKKEYSIIGLYPKRGGNDVISKEDRTRLYVLQPLRQTE